MRTTATKRGSEVDGRSTRCSAAVEDFERIAEEDGGEPLLSASAEFVLSAIPPDVRSKIVERAREFAKTRGSKRVWEIPVDARPKIVAAAREFARAGITRPARVR